MNARRRFNLWATLLILTATPAVHGQAPLLERLQQTIKEGVEAVAKPASPPPADEALQPYLGLTVDSAGQRDKGVRVIAVRPEGPASKAGLLVGDLVTAIGERPIRTMEDMATVLGAMRPGDRLMFHLERNGQPVSREVVVTSKAGLKTAPAQQPAPPPDPKPAGKANPGPTPPADATLPPPPPKESPAPAPKPLIGPEAEPLPQRPGAATLGITVAPITDEAQARYGLMLRKGALVTAIKPGSPCEKAHLPVGAAITAIDGRPIDSPLAAATAVRQLRVGQEIELSYYVGAELRRSKVTVAEGAGPVRPLQTPFAPPAKKPILDRVEGVIDRLVRPKDTPPQTAEAIRAEIDRLRRQISDLERRLKEME